MQADAAESILEDDEALAAAAGVRKGSARWLGPVLGLAALGAVGYFGYFQVWVPRKAAQEAAARVERERAAAEQERAAKERVAAEQQRTAAEQERLMKEKAAAAAARASAMAAEERLAADRAEKVADAGAERAVEMSKAMAQGDRLREREQPGAALDAYGRAADLEPARAEPLAGRGLALLDMGQQLQAEASFRQALKLNPRYGVALMGLAEAYRAQGKRSEAIQYYEKYLEVLPDGPEASVARAAIKTLQE